MIGLTFLLVVASLVGGFYFGFQYPKKTIIYKDREVIKKIQPVVTQQFTIPLKELNEKQKGKSIISVSKTPCTVIEINESGVVFTNGTDQFAYEWDYFCERFPVYKHWAPTKVSQGILVDEKEYLNLLAIKTEWDKINGEMSSILFEKQELLV